jgi:valyl-tRNA synthetase
MGAGFPAFGADAVRFTLATYPPSNKRIALAPRRIEGNRHFLNKIWNATRLSLELLGDYTWTSPKAPQAFFNRWIRSRFAAACRTANDGLDTFRIDEAALAAYRFFWNDLCDWYLELVKPVLRRASDGTFASPALVAESRETLAFVLEGSLRLMHPLMPFITEELWQRVPRPAARKASVAFGPYPGLDGDGTEHAPDVEAQMAMLQEIVSAARTVRSEHGIDWKAEVAMAVRSDSAEALALLRGQADAIALLVKTRGAPAFEGRGGAREAGTTVSVVSTPHGAIEVLVGLKGLVEKDAELARIDRELKKVERDLAALDKKLASSGFVDRAPAEVVDEARKQREMLIEARKRLEEARVLAAEL